jgi:hypothetical protein
LITEATLQRFDHLGGRRRDDGPLDTGEDLLRQSRELKTELESLSNRIKILNELSRLVVSRAHRLRDELSK